jgi:hypothetical protein
MTTPSGATHARRERRAPSQKVARFTGEGAYHGSTKRRPLPGPSPQGAPQGEPAPPPEMVPTALLRHLAEGREAIAERDLTFANSFALREQLEVPSPEAVRNDGVTFCWCPFDDALREAGPVTRRVLEAMAPHLVGDKRRVYVDSKIQHFEAGDLPVDSRLWHLDGTTVVRDERARRLGLPLLHDLASRLAPGEAQPPRYLAYLSAGHSATQFATAPLTVRLPELVPTFDLLDARVNEAGPRVASQAAGSIVAFDGCSLHRAVPATASGWRLWIRVVETDREVRIDGSILDCYDTVFRPTPQAT